MQTLGVLRVRGTANGAHGAQINQQNGERLLIKLRLFYGHEVSYRSTLCAPVSLTSSQKIWLSFAEITSHRPKFSCPAERGLYLVARCQIMLRLESERGLYRISDYLDWNFRFHVYSLHMLLGSCKMNFELLNGRAGPISMRLPAVSR